MNDAAITDDVDVEGEGEGGAPKRKLSGKKIVLFFVLPLLIVGGSTAALLLSGIFGGSKEQAAHRNTFPPSMATRIFSLYNFFCLSNSLYFLL